MDEFARIDRFFRPLAAGLPGALGLTDDVALLRPGAGMVFAVTTDAMVEGVHFLPGEAPALLARKLLRVNLSDLAAKGARPCCYLLTTALTVKEDEGWLAAFTAGLAADQQEFGIALAGGDSVRTEGRVVLSLTAFGEVPEGAVPLRAGARPGDRIYVSGTLGDAMLGLAVAKGRLDGLAPEAAAALLARHRLPQPRVALGLALRGVAGAAMDLSDGLPGDLAHICRASGVRAVVEAARLPLSAAAEAALRHRPDLRPVALAGGDDYELLFTAPPEHAPAVERAAAAAGTPVTAIGRIEAGTGCEIRDADGRPVDGLAGWQHFR